MHVYVLVGVCLACESDYGCVLAGSLRGGSALK